MKEEGFPESSSFFVIESYQGSGNNTEASRSGAILVTQEGSGKTATVSLSQAAGDVTWEYTLSVTPKTLSFETFGGTQEVSVTSYKRKSINGSYMGEQMNVGCSNSVSGTGFGTSGTSVSAGQNNTLADRSDTVTFTQSESGKKVSVALSQVKGAEDWNYTFKVSPSSLSFESVGGTKQISVTSYRCQTVNGIENGVQENVGYSSTVFGDGFSSAGTSVTARPNSILAGKIGSVIFTQTESGRTASVTLS